MPPGGMPYGGFSEPPLDDYSDKAAQIRQFAELMKSLQGQGPDLPEVQEPQAPSQGQRGLGLGVDLAGVVQNILRQRRQEENYRSMEGMRIPDAMALKGSGYFDVPQIEHQSMLGGMDTRYQEQLKSAQGENYKRSVKELEMAPGLPSYSGQAAEYAFREPPKPEKPPAEPRETALQKETAKYEARKAMGLPLDRPTGSGPKEPKPDPMEGERRSWIRGRIKELTAGGAASNYVPMSMQQATQRAAQEWEQQAGPALSGEPGPAQAQPTGSQPLFPGGMPDADPRRMSNRLPRGGAVGEPATYGGPPQETGGLDLQSGVETLQHAVKKYPGQAESMIEQFIRNFGPLIEAETGEDPEEYIRSVLGQ